MKLIIDIPEEIKAVIDRNGTNEYVTETLWQAVANGTPIPDNAANGEWIPVGKRLPKENGYYLTTTMYYEVYCDYWEGERFNRTESCIAWMPLPEPYKEGESE